MEAVKWMALNWPWVIIAVAIIIAFFAWGKQSLSRALELRHERRIQIIKTKAAELPFGNTLSEAEKTIELNKGIEIIEALLGEADGNALTSITLESQIKQASAYLAEVKGKK